MTTFRPMLAASVSRENLESQLPRLASPKIDGIRCVIVDGHPLTRRLLRIPNDHVYDALHGLPQFDGELVALSEKGLFLPFHDIQSAIMSKAGKPWFAYFVFDSFEYPYWPYKSRIKDLCERMRSNALPHVVLVPQTMISSLQEFDLYESLCLDLGFEGVILRSPDSSYKFGRSTLQEGNLLKCKRWETGDFKVIDFVPEFTNVNIVALDRLGYTKRSSEKAGLRERETLGALLVQYDGRALSVGTGFDSTVRHKIWLFRSKYLGCYAHIKFFPPARPDDLPRSPVFLGFRSNLDLEEEG